MPELVNLVPLDRVVMLSDSTTDFALLEQTLDDARLRMSVDSPNCCADAVRIRICKLESEKSTTFEQVQQALCASAAHH